ncbi:helix-turn-helix domain-containing protein [Streptomyces sp. NPDC007162]|uniref:PucR family transcriptional regulator n=1 Tax=Streptomyces sp. NPDC007162 TaxID=3156917 RepID=UPI0033E9E5DD
MSEADSWVRRLRPTAPLEDLEPTCLPETWHRTVAAIGLEPALWAVELSQEHALLGVEPDLRGARRKEAARRLQPATESVNMRALVVLAHGFPTPTTATPEMERQIENAVRRRVPLDLVLARGHASHTAFGDALIEQFRRLVPADKQMQGLSELSRYLVEHVSAFALACNTAYTTEEQAWLGSVEGVRGEVVRTLLRGEVPDVDPTHTLRYELANRTHIGLVLRRPERGDTAPERLDRRATELLTQIGAVGHLAIPTDEHEVWAWGAFVDSSVAMPRSIPTVPDLLVTVGRPAAGLEGFRTTHDEAVTAARVARLAPAGPAGPPGPVPGRTVFFEDVRLAALLTSDPERAANFVRDELGPLGGAREAVLRETVRVYLECNCSPRNAAARLNVVKNTVVYRVQRAEELLGRSVKEQQGILWTALHLAHVIDLAEMTSSA